MRIWFKAEIDQISENAIRLYRGDKIEALTALLNSDVTGLETKNHVIWALGKLNDKRVLPTLERLYTGKECDHSQSVCQRELKKAMNNLRGKRVDVLTFN